MVKAPTKSGSPKPPRKPKGSAFGEAVGKVTQEPFPLTQEAQKHLENGGSLEPPKRGPRGKSREGKVFAGVFLDPAAHKQLKHLAVDMDKDLQDLMKEGLNELFRKHGLPQIT